MRHEGNYFKFGDRSAGVYRFNGLLNWMKGRHTKTCMYHDLENYLHISLCECEQPEQSYCFKQCCQNEQFQAKCNKKFNFKLNIF